MYPEKASSLHMKAETKPCPAPADNAHTSQSKRSQSMRARKWPQKHRERPSWDSKEILANRWMNK